MDNVLVPIDGSAAALRALTYALRELGVRPDAQLHLLNVQAPLRHPWPGKLVSPRMIDVEQQTEGSQLLAPAEAMALTAGIACEAHVAIGAVAEEIVACAARHACDAIVMSTHGRGAVAGLVLGSVAQKVVHLTHVPVTLVK